MNNEIQMKTLSRRAMPLKTASALGPASLLTLSNSSHANPFRQGESGAMLKGRTIRRQPRISIK